MSNFISLQTAADMTSLYREQKEAILSDEQQNQNILPISETFDRTQFDSILSQEDCVKLRIYYGMTEDLKIHAIVVGVNDSDEDILPTQQSANSGIIEDGQRCPPECSPSSVLNS